MNTLDKCRECIQEYILNSAWSSGIEKPLLDWDIEGAAWDLRAAYDAAGVDLEYPVDELGSAIDRNDILNDVLQRNAAWNGEGWYTFERYATGTFDCPSPGTAEAIWIEDRAGFLENMHTAGGEEVIVSFYGNEELPSDPRVRVAEEFSASFPDATYERYRRRLDGGDGPMGRAKAAIAAASSSPLSGLEGERRTRSIL